MYKNFLRANCRGAGTRNEDVSGKGSSGGGGALNEQRRSLREQACQESCSSCALRASNSFVGRRWAERFANFGAVP